ncbi:MULTISPECIES: 4Fe-4S dicluster domain-containing protein [Rhizobium]|uniref:Ferredoxin n=1 Tax=Rhizobium tropici TaxID=398 RepID=A0A329Y711_RHITR|nr:MULTISPECIES: 4Fe-4S dicluster domain-containing protein [Rhizobium]MBB3286006.1 ferredoxin [Rhizobium sp. BK252]MBB3400832.1 ferredoxin [Rhizobium sp. BK289]MBB3413324.1 ferredoxin [Rhizobium sp. BK284]MBB3481298.1 ferredoxin [Rhizobium sp. BK347]MDK4723070.1 4Fe-4S dicluster domain-containing protein [Rhizobium sp. CNPSo 3968]
MSRGPVILEQLRAALGVHGVFVRGVVSFNEGEGPLLTNGTPVRSVALLGNIGGSIWPAFSAWRDMPGNGTRIDPLDDWSKEIIRPVAKTLGATAYFPSDPPWQPFQRWAMQAEGLQPSPLGILIHPEYGLWHGYRGALGFAEDLKAARTTASSPHPCASCVEKPCLTACPVEAITTTGFDVQACRSHLRTQEGQAGCMVGGCLARNICPVGATYRYPAEQLAFHMAALQL